MPVKNLQDWFDPNECKEKRKAITEIIDKLHEEQEEKNVTTEK